MANQNSAKTPPNPPLVINTTQLKNSSSSASELLGEWLNTCIHYSTEANVIVVPNVVPVDSPTIKFLLESVLDEGHIEESLNRATKSTFGHNDLTRASYYPEASQYRGVIKCASDRFEAFAWEKTTVSSGRAVYIGGYSTELEAAKAHDVVSLRLGSTSSLHTNFPMRNYCKEIDEMYVMSKSEYIRLIRRRKVKGFSGSDCDFRGVVRTNGGSRQWQAWLGRDKIDLPSILLGTYLSAEDAARAFDIALIGLKGTDAITNFDLTSYDVKGIMGRLPNHSMSSTQDSVTRETMGGEENHHLQSGNNEVVACLSNVIQHENNNFDLHHQQNEYQQLLFTPQLSNSTQSPSSSFQSNQTPDGLSGLIGTASPLSNSSSTPFFKDCLDPNDTQSGPCNLGQLVGTGSLQNNLSTPSNFFGGTQNSNDIQSRTCDLGGLNGGTSQWGFSSSSPSSFEVHQNYNAIQNSPCHLGGLVGNEYQHNLLSSSNIFEGNQNSIDLGGLNNAITRLNIASSSPSSFDGFKNSNYIQGSSSNLGGLIGNGYQQGNLPSLPSSFEDYQNSINIQSSPCDFGGLNRAISQLSIASPLPSSTEVHQNSNCIQGSSYNVGGLIGAGFQQKSNLSFPSSSFEGYQNSNSIQSSHCHLGGLSGTRAQSSDSPSLLSMIQGYPNSNHTQSNSCNLGGLAGTGSQINSSLASSSFLRCSQILNRIQSSPSNIGGLTGTRFQPSNQSSLLPPLQGYQSSNRIQSKPYDLGRVIRPRSQLGLNSSRIQSSPYNLSRLTRPRSMLSNTSPTPTAPQRTPFNIGEMTRNQVMNMAKLLSSPSHNCQNPNNIQSSTHSSGGFTRTDCQNPNNIQSSTHSSGAFTRTGSHVGNYGTSIGGNGAMASNQKSESLLKAMQLFGSTSHSQSQSQSSILNSQGNNNQNQIGSKISLNFSELPSGFGTRLLGAGGNYTSAFSLKLPRMVSETSSRPRAGTAAANNNGVGSSFMLNSNNVINNHVDVTPQPIIPQVCEPTLPLQQQHELVVQSHDEPNNLANDLNPQNTDQNLNNSLFSSFSPPQSPFPEPNAGGSSFISEMIGNDDDGGDFDITTYLNKDKMEEDFSGDVAAWLMMDVDESL